MDFFNIVKNYRRQGRATVPFKVEPMIISEVVPNEEVLIRQNATYKFKTTIVRSSPVNHLSTIKSN